MGCTSLRGAYSRKGNLIHFAPTIRPRSRLAPDATLLSTRPHTTYRRQGSARPAHLCPSDPQLAQALGGPLSNVRDSRRQAAYLGSAPPRRAQKMRVAMAWRPHGWLHMPAPTGD
eukprot:scaffold300557_cov45-Tisochrysis_lutea.AAC.1